MAIYAQGKKVRHRYCDALSAISWQAFEHQFARHYRNQGYRVDHTGTGSKGSWFDGGIDIKLYRGEEYIVVQCKHWNALQVTHNYVHELIGIMHTQGASGAVLVTSGEFSTAAREAAARCPAITLVDGAEVRRIFEEAEPTIVAAAPPFPLSPALPVHRSRSHGRRGSDMAPIIVAGSIVAAVFLAALVHTLNNAARDAASELATTHALAQTQASAPPITPMVNPPGPAAVDARYRHNLQATHAVDHEAARAALRGRPGVGTTTWLNNQTLLVMVTGAEFRNQAMIDDVCTTLAPLGDTPGVVVNVQDVTARTSEGAAVIARICPL